MTTSNRDGAQRPLAAVRQPGAQRPSHGAGLDPSLADFPRAHVTARYSRTVRRLLIASVLTALAAGFALGILFTLLEVS